MFEACSGVLLGGVLHLSGIVVSILFILPIPAAFFGAWYAGRPGKPFATLMWHAVLSCLLAGLLMWMPSWFGIINIWTLIVPAALFFWCRHAVSSGDDRCHGAVSTVGRGRRRAGGRTAERRIWRDGTVFRPAAAERTV